jgi:hypothetical protein
LVGTLLVVLGLLLTVWVVGPGAAQAPQGSSGIQTALSISGDWVVKTTESYTDTMISLNGSLTVEQGGDLTLNDVTLTISEPSDLGLGVIVDSQGTLTGVNFVLESSNSARPTYLQADPGASLSLTGGALLDLRGATGSGEGVLLEAAGAQLTGVTFDHYGTGIEVNDAANVHLSNLVFRNSTGDDSTYAVRVIGTSNGFWLRNSLFAIPQEVGALAVSAPNAQVTGNIFNLNPYGSNADPVLLNYMKGGVQSAAGSYFANNTVDGAGVIDQASSNVTILDNLIENTGPSRPYGILGTVPVGTNPGLWLTGLVVEGNHISNFTRYGIRLELNVTHFLVTENTITSPSPHPGPAWTEKWGGPQIDGIYLIRSISDGIVSHNLVDDSDAPGVASNGMTIESNVTDVKVQFNVFLNMTQNGIVTQGNVPGFDNSHPWQRGPTTGILIANNLFDNERAVQQNNFTFKGLLFWLWANHTTVENNTFIGFQDIASPKYSLDGAFVVSDGSYGIYVNNTVIGARLGFVFTSWINDLKPYVGEFNRSDNLVYDNHLYGIEGPLVEETPNDGMGPIHNVIVALDNTTGGLGLPTSYVESIAPSTAVALSEEGGVYQESLRTVNPIHGGLQTFSTTLPWSYPSFNVSSDAGFGAGYPDVAVTALNRTAVTYHVPATGSGEETVQFYPTDGSYSALYLVNVSTNSSSSSFELNSTSGPATFAIGGGSEATVRTSLLSWWPTSWGLGNNSTPSASSWSIVGSVELADGLPASNVSISLLFATGSGTEFPILTETTPGGGFAVNNLSFAANLTSVEVLSTNYTTLGYSSTAAPGALLIAIEVTTPSNYTTPVTTIPPVNATQPVAATPELPAALPSLSGAVALSLIVDFAGIILCGGLLGISLRRVSIERHQKRARRSKYT